MADYSQDDFNDLCRAIRRYAEEDMDQWANFRIPFRHGDLFVSIGLAPVGGPESAYPLYDPDS